MARSQGSSIPREKEEEERAELEKNKRELEKENARLEYDVTVAHKKKQDLKKSMPKLKRAIKEQAQIVLSHYETIIIESTVHEMNKCT